MKRKTAGELADFFAGMPRSQEVTFLAPRTVADGHEDAKGRMVETAYGEFFIQIDDTDELNFDLTMRIEIEGAVDRGQL